MRYLCNKSSAETPPSSVPKHFWTHVFLNNFLPFCVLILTLQLRILFSGTLCMAFVIGCFMIVEQLMG
jgi:hypothetical protein